MPKGAILNVFLPNFLLLFCMCYFDKPKIDAMG